MKTTYFYGDEAKYTGKEMDIHGGRFYEIQLVEGRFNGQLRVVKQAPEEKKEK